MAPGAGSGDEAGAAGVGPVGASIRVAWLVAPLPARGGTLTHLRAWADGLASSDVRPILLYHSPEEDSGIPIELPDSLERIRVPALDWSVSSFSHAVRSVTEILARHRVDLVHTVFVKADLVGGVAAHRLQVPVVSTVEGDLLVSSMGALRRTVAALAYQHVSKRFARVMPVSQGTAERLKPYLAHGADRVEVVYPGVSVPERGAGAGKRWAGHVLAVGRLVPVKGFHRLIAAVAIARSFLSGLHLTIVGDGPERSRLARYALAHGMADQVTMTGWVSAVDMATWYDWASLLAISSRWEGLPWVALEAMARGVPVLAPRVGGLPELIVEGSPETSTGFLVNSGQVPDLVSGLLRAFGQPGAPDRLERTGRLARRRVLDHFSSEREMAGIRRVYQQVVSEGRA